jgi:hypothetical protein
LLAEDREVLGGCLPAKGSVELAVVVEAGKGIDAFVEAIQAAGQVVAGVELVAPSALGALDGAVEVGSLGRQDERLRRGPASRS